MGIVVILGEGFFSVVFSQRVFEELKGFGIDGVSSFAVEKDISPGYVGNGGRG